MRRRMLMFGLMFVLIASIFTAGCSSKSDSGSQNSSTPENTASGSENSSGDSGKSSGKTTEVSMLFAESLFGGIQDDLIKEFEASHPDIKIKPESLPDGGIFDALRVRITTGEVPDIFQINIGHITTSMADEAGYIYDLKDMDALKNYASSIVEASKINGKVADFSLGVGVLGLEYDKKVLEAAGYTEPFKSWDEMMQAGQKLKDQGKDLLVYSSKWETAIANVFHWTFAHKALQDPQFKQAYLSNTVDWSKYQDVLKEGFERFKELNQYVRTGSFTNEYAVAQQSFTNGDSAMIIGGTWEAGAIHQLNPDLQLGFMNLPYAPEDENPYIFVPEDGTAINAKSDHIEAAKTFLNWLFSKETYAKIQKAKGSMSAMPGVGTLDPAYSAVPDWLNTDRVISFANTGPIPGPTWVALGQAAQKYTFDNDLDGAIKSFVNEYNKTKSN